MIVALIVGVACLLIGGAFYWLNLNSPVQTCIPAVMLPLGAAIILFCLGWMVAR